MKIPIGISRRHAHLTKEIYEKLFGSNEIEVRNYLNQPGEFASNSTIDLKWNDKVLERIRVVGPYRNYNQIELSKTDADLLEIDPPIRKSGDVIDSHPIILVGPEGEVHLNEGVVRAQRHVHIDDTKALELNLKDDDQVLIYKDGKETYDAFIKVSNPAFLEAHIDYDEAEVYDFKQSEEVEIYKCGK